ncbi:peptidase C39 family protein [Deinococcus yavapaiensis]|uniref:Uncharacterized protein YvpB n=1 Tax=Deinococcus yavapaiensis KR-236 TaxID=694435 RepID=A0A318S8M0_9DEIO|nr:peptidase C39 family protein [Deinococcus yavapaiensis]PYE54196.1 uncharacterized protein YvpB [Deinococcus yavapaiensis KR-236]
MRRALLSFALLSGGFALTHALSAPVLTRHVLDLGTGRFESNVVEVALFTELVPSWNAAAPNGSSVTVEVRARVGARWTKYFSFGRWSEGDGRASVNGQQDADGDVLTDTLRLSGAANAFQYRVTTNGQASVRLVTFTTTNGRTEPSGTSNRAAWGKVLDVPPRTQLAFQGGDVWCSPTSVSMVLAYWGKNVTVPEAARGVFDPAWSNGGTGNWAFNAAYAGSLGFTAYATRFSSLADVERLVLAGVPSVLSVAWKAGELPSAFLPSTSGHVLVVVGFEQDGDVVVNDPYANSDAEVRRTYPRATFERLWLRASNGTAYVIVPLGKPL